MNNTIIINIILNIYELNSRQYFLNNAVITVEGTIFILKY